MRATAHVLSAAAIVGLVAAAPAPEAQAIEFAAIFAADPVTLTAPPLAAITQVDVIDTSALVASVKEDVTTQATAAVTGAAASNAANISPSSGPISLKKRETHQKRDLLSNIMSMLGARFGQSGSSGQQQQSAQTTSKTTAGSTAATTAAPTSGSSTYSPVGAAQFVNTATTTSTSSNSGSGTATTSSGTACPTTPEDGTYCGFINPEDPCAPQPDGAGPKVTPDTTDAFLAYAPFQSMAANAKTPAGYVNTFKNYNASSSANSYMGLHTLNSYNPADCAAWCDNTTSCTAFNIYIERDPSQNPCQNDSTAPTVWGYWCPNPSSITNYKCTLWGSNLDGTTATNQGGWRGAFPVVVTGSNGYDKTNITTPIQIPAYDPPSNCSGKATTCQPFWLGSKFFNGPYDPTLCAAYANATSATNKQIAQAAGKTTYTPCQMFNAYYLYRNNVPQGTYCALFNAQLQTNWATTPGSWSGRDFWGVRNSWQYQLSTPDRGRC